MFARIKAFLDNTVLWAIFLLGCVAFFWRKEKDLEDELAETKANERIKDDEEKQSQLDHAAANDVDEYQRIRDAYLRSSDKGSEQGPSGETSSN